MHSNRTPHNHRPQCECLSRQSLQYGSISLANLCSFTTQLYVRSQGGQDDIRLVVEEHGDLASSRVGQFMQFSDDRKQRPTSWSGIDTTTCDLQKMKISYENWRPRNVKGVRDKRG